MQFDISKLGALLREAFITDSGKLDVLLVVCALIALVYAIALIVMPFAVLRLRRETIQLKKLAQAQLNSDKATRDVLREIASTLAAESAYVKRAARGADARKPAVRKASKEDAEDGQA